MIRTMLAGIPTPAELRQFIVRIITENARGEQDFLEGLSVGEYTAQVLDPTRWGGELELSILSRHCDVTLFVRDCATSQWFTYQHGSSHWAVMGRVTSSHYVIAHCARQRYPSEADLVGAAQALDLFHHAALARLSSSAGNCTSMPSESLQANKTTDLPSFGIVHTSTVVPNSNLQAVGTNAVLAQMAAPMDKELAADPALAALHAQVEALPEWQAARREAEHQKVILATLAQLKEVSEADSDLGELAAGLAAALRRADETAGMSELAEVVAAKELLARMQATQRELQGAVKNPSNWLRLSRWQSRTALATNAKRSVTRSVQRRWTHSRRVSRGRTKSFWKLRWTLLWSWTILRML